MAESNSDWVSGPASQRIDAGQVHVWHISLDGPEHPALSVLLSQDEQARADRFHFERDRRRYIKAHAALRVILARYLRQEPEGLSFDTEERGKPYLIHRDLPFNLSHAGERALLAVGTDLPVGVDIEYMREDFDLMGIARRFFTPGEVACLEPLSGAEQVTLFYRIWTIKEAFLKGLGFGLHLSPEHVDVSAGLAVDVFELVNERESWEGHILPGFPSYVGALAVRGSGWQVGLYEYVPES